MANSHIQHHTKRSKRRIKYKKISRCLQRAKVFSYNYKNLDLEAKKLWH